MSGGLDAPSDGYLRLVAVANGYTQAEIDGIPILTLGNASSTGISMTYVHKGTHLKAVAMSSGGAMKFYPLE